MVEVTVSNREPIEAPRVSRSDRPSRRSDVAAVPVPMGGVIASEHAQRPALLDHVSWGLWQAMDGNHRMEDLAQDLAWATGIGIDAAGAQLGWLVRALAVDGFLDHPQPVAPVLPRRIHPDIPEASCLGRRLGLSRSQIVQLGDTQGSPFLAGCTLPEILDEVTGDLRLEPVEGLGKELLFLRATRPQRGLGRLQQLFDSMGNPMFVGRDLESATEAFGRTIRARQVVGDGIWSEGVSLERSGSALLVHPAFRDAVAGELRTDLGDLGITFIPSGLLRFDGVESVTAPAVDFLGIVARRWKVAAVMAPCSVSGGSVLCSVLALARRWDQVHLEHFGSLVRAGSVVECATNQSPRDVLELIDALLPDR